MQKSSWHWPSWNLGNEDRYQRLSQKLEQLRVNHVAIPRDLYHQIMQETDSVKILELCLAGYEAKKIKKKIDLLILGQCGYMEKTKTSQQSSPF